MDQNNSGFGNNGGIGINSGSDTGSMGTGNPGGSNMNSSTGNTGFGSATGSDTGTCAHCGKSIGGGQNKGLDQFLGRIGISEDMINNLKSQMQNVDVEEYLNTAREYLRGAGDKAKIASTKAGKYAKDNPRAIAAGVAVLAVGAGLLINAMRDKNTY